MMKRLTCAHATFGRVKAQGKTLLQSLFDDPENEEAILAPDSKHMVYIYSKIVAHLELQSGSSLQFTQSQFPLVHSYTLHRPIM